jgi:hypothetical protein
MGIMKQNAKKAAGERDCSGHPEIKFFPETDKHQGRHCEDDARRQGLPGGGGSLHLIGLQHRAVAQHPAQNHHGDNRRGD